MTDKRDITTDTETLLNNWYKILPMGLGDIFGGNSSDGEENADSSKQTLSDLLGEPADDEKEKSTNSDKNEQHTQDEIIKRMQHIDPYEFEEFIAELWSLVGYETTVSQSSDDMGVDVVAKQRNAGVSQKLGVQVKRYSEGNKVGRPSIQQYHALKEQDTDIDAAVIVTTSSFTSPGRQWANKNNVKLINGDDLAETIEGQYEVLLDEYAPTLDAIDEQNTQSESSDENSKGLEDVFFSN